MIDTSDGLLAELGHIALAVSIDVRTEMLEVPQRLSEVASALVLTPGTGFHRRGGPGVGGRTRRPAVTGGWRQIVWSARIRDTVDGAVYEGGRLAALA